jgi:hypothetical protein
MGFGVIVPNNRLPTERCGVARVDGFMKRDLARYEVFPAQAVQDGERVRVTWAWQRVVRSGVIRHAALYDTLEDCLASINRRCRHSALPAVRVILDSADASPARV